MNTIKPLNAKQRDKPIGVGIIGLGHWGFKWIRIFNESGAQVKACCDINDELLKSAVNENPRVIPFKDYRGMLKTEGIDAIYIATPPITHYRIAKECLLAKKHVLVEKPITVSHEIGLDLVKLGEETNRIIMVGNTYIYNEAIKKTKNLLLEGKIGQLRYIQSWMTNSVDMWAGKEIGNYSDVLWDLGPHQISIARYLVGKEPLEVSAVCPYMLKGEITHQLNDAATVNLHFPNDVLVTISLNWLDHSRNRRVFVSGEEGIINIEDISNKLATKVTINSISCNNHEIINQTQVLEVPTNDTLANECEHFLSCIRNNLSPITDGENGVSTVKVLEAAQKSMSNKGAFVKIE